MYQKGLQTKSINSAKYGKENENSQQKSQLGQQISNTVGVLDGLNQLKSGTTWYDRAKGIASIITSMTSGK